MSSTSDIEELFNKHLTTTIVIDTTNGKPFVKLKGMTELITALQAHINRQVLEARIETFEQTKAQINKVWPPGTITHITPTEWIDEQLTTLKKEAEE